MHAEKVAISAIAAEVDTPFYCYSKSAIEDSYLDYERAFSQLFSSTAPQKKTLICYAVKANGNQAVLTTLAQLGSGADVVSLGEIRRAIRAGIPANKIVYSGVAKTAGEIEYALKLNIFQKVSNRRHLVHI
jgi:diaminopimelate decarboxylase